MPPEPAPQPIIDLAESRAAARRARDWGTADRLRVELEAAGWRVIDAGTLYTLERAAPPDLVEGGFVRYGSSASVPSRLADQPVGLASVVMIAAHHASEVAGPVRSLVDHAPDGTQIVIVANDLPDVQAEELQELDEVDPGAPGIDIEVVWTSARLGYATALNIGIRRASAAVVILLDPAVEPTGDIVTPLVLALEDPTVAVAGPFGAVSADLRRFRPAPAAVDVDVIEGRLLAFRRADYATRGPLDEHFVVAAHLDTLWSLVLRDRLPNGGGTTPIRRAVQIAGMSVDVARPRPGSPVNDATSRTQARRNLYRVLKRFATRRDLLVGNRDTLTTDRDATTDERP